MRNVWFAFLIVLFASLVTKTSGSGTGGGGGGGTTGAASTANLPVLKISAPKGGAYCTVIANSVRADSAAKRILAGGRFVCDRPGPDSLSMTVSLQKRGANGQWTTLATRQFSASGASTTRDQSNVQRTREVSAGCAAGVYRTTMSATSVSAQKQRTFAMTSVATTDPCSR